VHAAAGETLQKRLKTAAREKTTTRTLERELGKIWPKQVWIWERELYTFNTNKGILILCSALLSFVIKDAWTSKGQAT